MADKKISALTAATTPLAGTEVLPIVQSATTVKATIANVQAAPVAAGTANGVQYLDNSKVPTTGSALQFDGTRFYNGLTAPPSGWTGTGVGMWIKQSTASGIGFVAISSSNDAGTYMGNSGTAGIIGVSYGATAGYKPLNLQTSDLDQVSIDTSGNMSLVRGNVVMSLSGKGIDFSATPGTGTSELFADYEEGTWTPNQGSGLTVTGTFGSSGTYTKIGRMVFVTARITASVSMTCGGGFICSNLPFAIGAATTGSLINSDSLGNPGSTLALPAASSSLYASAVSTPTGSITYSIAYPV